MRTQNLCEGTPSGNLGTCLLILLGVGLAFTGPGFFLIVPIWIVSYQVRKYRFLDRWQPLIKRRNVEFMGGLPEYGHLDIYFSYGRLYTDGIAYREGNIYIIERGTVVEIPWGSVRSWAWNIYQAEQLVLVGGSAGDAMKVNRWNAESRGAAKAASGFTVTVADIQKPTWRFATTDRLLCQQWMEIFAQVNEGRLARAA